MFTALHIQLALPPKNQVGAVFLKEVQWRSQPKNLWGAKCLTLSEQQYFCLGCLFSKHKMTRYAKNFTGHGPLGPFWLRL